MKIYLYGDFYVSHIVDNLANFSFQTILKTCYFKFQRNDLVLTALIPQDIIWVSCSSLQPQLESVLQLKIILI